MPSGCMGTGSAVFEEMEMFSICTCTQYAVLACQAWLCYFANRGNIKTDMSGRTWICEGVIVRSESETGVTGDRSSRGAYVQAVEKSNSTVIR